MKEENIMKNIDFPTVVSSVFTTEFNYAIKTDVKNDREMEANKCKSKKKKRKTKSNPTPPKQRNSKWQLKKKVLAIVEMQDQRQLATVAEKLKRSKIDFEFQ